MSRGLISIFLMTQTHEQNTTNSGIHHCRLMTRSWSPHATLLFNLGPLQTQQHPLQANQCSKHHHQPVQTSERPRWHHGLPLQNSWSSPNGCRYMWSRELADVIYILDVYVKGIITFIMYFHCCIPGYSHNRYDRFFGEAVLKRRDLIWTLVPIRSRSRMMWIPWLKICLSIIWTTVLIRSEWWIDQM